MPWLQLRNFILEPGVQEEIEAARREFRRFDEAWAGAEWLLVRNPTPQGSFPTTYHGKPFMMFGWRGDLFADMPDMWLVYTYDDEEVRIYGINATEALPPDDDD
jgi:hypothetical protein